MTKKIEFGDFQTPFTLAEKCVELMSQFINPDYVVEPTCGVGAFLEAAHKKWGQQINYQGYEINQAYIDTFIQRYPLCTTQIKLDHGDFFKLDLDKLLPPQYKWPLIIGNPPWVTNSQLGMLRSKNLPKKNNEKGLSGIDALTGKSNFDISEWMITRLLQCLAHRNGMLAMLCKTSVARNVFLQCTKLNFCCGEFKIFRIDAKKEFGVSVDACLFIVDFTKKKNSSFVCQLYGSLNCKDFQNDIGVVDGRLIANLNLFKQVSNKVKGKSSQLWRSGVKHDAAKVMELKHLNGKYYNGYNEPVLIEQEYLYPLLKSSDIANNRLEADRFVIMTQKKMGDDTKQLKFDAPKLWKYLEKNEIVFAKRASSIYKKKAKYSIFGVGEYSFMPYKIAISGLYKKINFCLLEPIDGKPIMVDDTCYILGFERLEDARKYFQILNSDLVTSYIKSLVFWDAKRPINSEMLNTIDVVCAVKYWEQEKVE